MSKTTRTSPSAASRARASGKLGGGTPSRTFMAVIAGDDNTTMTGIELPFDPKDVFGKVRAPVLVSVGGHTYRSTVCRMEGRCFVPLRRSNREAAGVEAGQRCRVTLTLDEGVRKVDPPADLAAALNAAGLREAFSAMSFSHQREHVEAVIGAKKPETRVRRIARCIEMIAERARASSEAGAGRAGRTR